MQLYFGLIVALTFQLYSCGPTQQRTDSQLARGSDALCEQKKSSKQRQICLKKRRGRTSDSKARSSNFDSDEDSSSSFSDEFSSSSSTDSAYSSTDQQPPSGDIKQGSSYGQQNEGGYVTQSGSKEPLIQVRPVAGSSATQQNASENPDGLYLSAPGFETTDSIPDQMSSCPENNSVHKTGPSNIFPELVWQKPDSKIISFVMIIEDYTKRNTVHFFSYNIPATTTSIPLTMDSPNAQFPGTTGENFAGKKGWTGPCPENGEHAYGIRLYAMDLRFNSPIPTMHQKKFETKYRDNILYSDVLHGRFRQCGGKKCPSD